MSPRNSTELSSDNLSHLMLDVYDLFVSNKKKEIHGLSLKLTGFDKDGNIAEDNGIRDSIDQHLITNGRQPIITVANTIFPANLWNPELDRKTLYKRYGNILPKIKKCKGNNHGLYFERMIDYVPDAEPKFNQIENIIEFFNSGTRRRSAFQVSVWDPTRDQKGVRQRGFPYLQHYVVSCVQQKVILMAFYATQFVFERAYGNLLGLCNLAKFFGYQVGLPVESLMCYVGVEQRDVSPKILQKILAENET